MHLLYRDLVKERVRYALAAARAVQPLEHSGVKGAIREVLMADLFRPLFASDIGVASGLLISTDGGQSRQQDIILFDKRILPPILFEQGPAIVPVEAALICIEVKSTLTATELRSAHANAQSVRALTMSSGTMNEKGDWVDIRTSAVSSVVLALDSDLRAGGLTEAERYMQLLEGEQPVLGMICVAGRGAWCPTERIIYDRPSGNYFKEDGTPITNQWREVKANEFHAEILELLAQSQFLVQKIAGSRGRPPLNAYLK